MIGNIKPGISPHLEKTLDEFNNINLKEEYIAALNAKGHFDIDLHVYNDGNAMLAGIVEAIRKGTIQNLLTQNGTKILRSNLHNKYVTLLGIGTGISHAIAEIDT